MPLILIVTKKKEKTLKDTREKDKACKTESRIKFPEHLKKEEESI